MASGLLAELELKGRVVTGDALYAQRELSRSILEQGGDYFWVVKDNQPGVREAVSLLFEHPPWGESFGEACLEGRHGDRWEHRRLWASTALERVPGLARVGTGLLRGTNQEAQGQGDGGAGLRHHQPPAGTGGCCQVAGDLAGTLLAWALENRKQAALGAGCGIRRGPEPSEDRVGAATDGGVAQPGNRPVEAERSQKRISSPAPLRLETLGGLIPHRPLPQLLKDPDPLLSLPSSYPQHLTCGVGCWTARTRCLAGP